MDLSIRSLSFGKDVHFIHPIKNLLHIRKINTKPIIKQVIKPVKRYVNDETYCAIMGGITFGAICSTIYTIISVDDNYDD
jgi:hypothetical protein